MANLEKEKAKVEERLKASASKVKQLQTQLNTLASEVRQLKAQLGASHLKEMGLQGEINELQARADSAESALNGSWVDNAQLAAELEAVKREAAEVLARQRSELEALATSEVAAAVEEFKSSKERNDELEKIYDFAYNASHKVCLDEV
ncbi:uncharacterized protein LOC131243363 isoform X2 [Magnolia sinica]|uniref:uncharacterized protein LOC131243363 isoform X2 n=1 Tax=Magnolia sinica TaxID=86752 RepID=UPI002657DD29|nr:uncharacterized protein LOC131243363 isoform X2 [Magnolia sinica]